MTRRYCYTLDLKNDPTLIAEYKKHHEKVWPEVLESYRECGVDSMEIYLLGTRMFMIMEVNEHFSFEKKAKLDVTNTKVQQWEQLMGKFQQVSPHAQNGDKWMAMECIFRLESLTGENRHLNS
jgi:L-rhamnose mutarotase